MNCASPAVTPSPPPGSCRLCVTSKTTGQNARMIGNARMSTTRLLYPNVKPRSVTKTFELPAAVTFEIAWRTSAGARNCPFFRLTVFPVRAAASTRSVCRERNAGICRTSATSATGAACAASWMSVRIGRPVRSRTSARIRRPSFSPGPRNDRPEVRFALSYDALKTHGIPARRAMSRTAIATPTA